MNDLEDTHCEIRRTVDLQLSPLSPNSSFEDDASPPLSPPSPCTLGGFFPSTNYSWLACRSRLTVFNTKTGASISSWKFRHRISSISPFPSSPGQIPLLLVGLDNDAPRLRDSRGAICVFDCTISQVLRAIRTPSGVEQLCVISGGAPWEDPDDRRGDILPGSSGLGCAALRSLDHLVVDLRRTSWEEFQDYSQYDESNPAELDLPEPSGALRHRNRERHACHNLMSTRIEKYIDFKREDLESSVLQDILTTSLIHSRKIGCVISGCLGHVILWQTDGIVRWISPPSEESISISHLALLEPTDDPRPFCYLWVAYQEESDVPPVLKMFAMLFERKYFHKGTNQYFTLKGEPSMKLELELEGNKIVGLCPVTRDSCQETETGTKSSEESLLLVSTEGRSFLFDLNQWYKEQMPRTIGDCANVEAILSAYSRSQGGPEGILSCVHVPLTLKEFPGAGQGAPEEFFFPNSLSLEWSELSTNRITTWMTRGVQSQLLRDMSLSGPVIMLHPAETFHRCASFGLIPLNGDSFNSDPDFQRDALLTLVLQQRWTTFLLRCVREWSDGSAAYLFPAFIRWAVQRASTIKLTAHRLCIPLFDQSGCSIGEAEVRSLRSLCQQMECLSNVVDNLPLAQDQDQQRTLKRITVYLQVLLWFLDVGLLPECQDVDEESLPISIVPKIPYPAEKLISMYREKREKQGGVEMKKSEKEENLFIDELITRDCSFLVAQWEREATDTISDGRYPPPSLQSLLRGILTDCYHPETNEMENKHQIIIYLLMDLVMLLQGSCPSVDQLVKYPAAFKLSPSLIKLTQALWLLDHEDYQGFLEIMTGQLVCDSDVKDWHHKLVIRTLIKSGQNKLALIYLRVRKPPLSSLEEQGTVISLSVEHGLVQSAFHRRPPSHYSQLLMKFFKACKDNDRLNDILHLAMDFAEEETFVQFLEEEKCDETRLLYYLQRSRYNEAGGISLGKNSSKKSSFAVFSAYQATLPEVTRRFNSQLGKRNIQEPEGNFPRPFSHIKSQSRVREMHEAVIRKARETFSRGDRLQIPFVTAPSMSLKAGVNSNEGNCVMFAERSRLYGKRTLDQMREEEPEASVGPRKRRRTDESRKEDSRQLSLSMVFDTPLVKRKNQMSARSTAAETPHSILKIRRMIQKSLSPKDVQASPSEEEREKRPRQIRFSIIPKMDESSIDGDPPPGDDVQNEVAGDSNLSNPESDGFHSAEISENLGQSTVLSDDTDISFPLPGPRPRPSLRKNLDEDLLRKSLIKNCELNRNSSLESSRLSLDNSVFSDIVSSTLLNPATPRGSRYDPPMCASTVLSPGSSFEFPSGEHSPRAIKKNGNCSIDTTESVKDESQDGMDEGGFVEEIVTTTSITTTILRGFSVDRTDVNDNTEENFQGEKSYHSLELEERMEVTESSRVGAQGSPEEENPEDEEEVVQKEMEEQEEEQLPSEDYDEELLALKYEDDDDNDDVFKSLSNSMDVQDQPENQLQEEIQVPEGVKKTATSRFYEELNITDDESRSVDESLFKRKLQGPPVGRESLNITDDESDPEGEDVAKSFSNRPENPVNPENAPEEIPEEDEEKIQENVVEEEIREGVKEETQEDVKEKTQEDVKEKIQEEFVEVNVTPVRMTRSRASSLASETPEELKTPRTRRATSLVQDLPSPKTSASSESPTAGKRRGRRATSLVKEVLTSSMMEEAPVRRSSRRKEPEAVKTTHETIEEAPEEPEPVKKTRARRGASAAKDSTPVKDVTPRRTRGASVVKEEPPEEEKTLEMRVKRTRGGSVAKDQEEVPRRTRAVSVTDEEPKTRAKRGRTVSSSSEVNEEILEKKGRPRRGATASEGSEETEKRRVRASSEVNEVGERPRRTRATSVTSEGTEEIGKRTTRAASVVKDPEESGRPRRTRTNSASSGVDEEETKGVKETSAPPPRKTRGGSVSKDQETDPVGTRRTTRASSVSKDEEGEVSIRSTRRRAKELPSESLRTRRGGSIVKEVIPEENSDESISGPPGGSRIPSIPEEDVKEGRRRGRRAVSVDLSPVEEKELGKRQKGRKRAASETKDLVEEVVERPRRGRKPKKEEFQFAAPEEARGPIEATFEGQVPDFIFSPPFARSRDGQDRREIVNFIPPLTEEERKMIPVKSRMRGEEGKQVRMSHVPGYRTKFVVPKWSRGNSK
ncbi:protein ELYS [Fopius arisanus]|uniref:Ahctf1 protein n=1 Tax=Fopius arisanus TaxID=64838 RepID=A0A0C9Q2X8_9HYME|nr:PREDICTED: protein ELYS [Fopius arisanus]